MKKLFKGLTALIMVLVIINPINVFAYNIPETVRIGLEYKYKNVSSVPISETKISIGINGDMETGITSTSGSFSVNVTNEYFVVAKSGIRYYDEALSSCVDYITKGYNAVPAYVGENNWCIYIGGYSDYNTAFQIAQNIGGIVSNADNDKMVLKDGNATIMVFDNIYPQIKSDSRDYTLLSDRSYRGAIEFGRYSGGNITAVNVVNIEEYLYSVVASEMPASYGFEALKAQAVAARSYTMTRMSAHSSSGYELCDGVHCQAYKGYGGETATTNNAVDATKGVMAYYAGSPINAVFHASSGGHTDNSENVWLNYVPYLRGVPELNEIDMNTWSRTYTTAEIEAIVAANGDYVGNVIDIVLSNISETGHIVEIQIVGTAGTVTVSKEGIRSYFSSNGGSLESRVFTINGKGTRPVGSSGNYVPPIDNTVTSQTDKFNILGRDGVTTISSINNTYVISSQGNVTTGNEILNVANSSGTNKTYYTANSGYTATANSTYSAASPSEAGSTMYINPSPVSTADGSGKFVFEGYGWGHGAGMSQKGANGMAQMGYTYDQILKYYYTGIEVK